MTPEERERLELRLAHYERERLAFDETIRVLTLQRDRAHIEPPAWWIGALSRVTLVVRDFDDPSPIPQPPTRWRITAIDGLERPLHERIATIESLTGERLRLPVPVLWDNWVPEAYCAREGRG
jgi:hypothetical protein